MINILAILLLLSTTFSYGSGCSIIDQRRNHDVEFIGTTWILDNVESIENSAHIEFSKDETYSIKFSHDGQIHAVSDCNSCTGSYIVDQDSLISINASCTEAACRPGGSSFSRYNQSLLGAFAYSLIDDQLRIYFIDLDDNKQLMLFRPSK